MRRLLTSPLVLLAMALIAVMLLRAAPAAAEPFTSGQVFRDQQVVAVTAAALAFITPRTLDAIKPSQLTIWGLRGLTTLDSRLMPELRADDPAKPVLRLSTGARVLFSRPAPPEADLTAWAMAITDSMRAGWENSDPLRRAGTGTLIRVFFDEMFNHLDPYTRYTPPLDANKERLRRAGSATLGLELTTQRGTVTVQSVDAGSAASQGGIRPGERVVSIEGESLQSADAATLRALLEGPDGSDAELVIRGRDGKLRSVTLTRSLLPPETVTSRLDDDIIVVTISNFARNTAARLAQELIRHMGGTPAPRGVVIDLRGNRGGVLQQGVAAAAMLQPSGVVARTVGRDPEAAHDFVADSRDLTAGLPVVIMVDGRTASSAELMAASLADQRRAVVIGSSTLGKGLVQAVTTLPDGGELFVTWSRVIAPRGWPIQELGVLPQLCTSLGSAEAEQQLQALSHGQQKLAAALARHRAARAPVTTSDALQIRATCPAAEPREGDLAVALSLIADPTAYATALLPKPPVPSILGSAARPTSGLTQPTLVRN